MQDRHNDDLANKVEKPLVADKRAFNCLKTFIRLRLGTFLIKSYF